MRYALDFSHVIKHGRNRFYTICTTYFTEEEKAIIRVRNMGGYRLLFKRGWVNCPSMAGVPLDEDGSLIAYIFFFVSAAVLWIAISIWFALIPLLFAIWLHFHNFEIEYANKEGKTA